MDEQARATAELYGCGLKICGFGWCFILLVVVLELVQWRNWSLYGVDYLDIWHDLYVACVFLANVVNELLEAS